MVQDSKIQSVYCHVYRSISLCNEILPLLSKHKCQVRLKEQDK